MTTLIIVLICVTIVIVLVNFLRKAQPEDNTPKSSVSQTLITNTRNTSSVMQDQNNTNLSLSELASQSDFVAIDIKQANYSTCSACSVGLAFSDGKKIIGTRHFYVKPVPYKLESEHAGKYGITEDDVKDAPDFVALWYDELSDILTCDIICCNADSISNMISDSYYASVKDIKFKLVTDQEVYDVVQIYRDVFPNSYEYTLNTISEKINTAYNDNDALSTAICVAKTMIDIIKRSGYIHIYTGGLLYHFVHDRCKKPYVKIEDRASKASLTYNSKHNNRNHSNNISSDNNDNISIKGEFIAIDFETANYERTSACAVGLAFVKDGVIVSTEHYYIKPHPNYYVEKFIDIHGITKDITNSAPTFSELWNNTLKEKLDGKLLVSYNADFDIGVLSSMLSHLVLIDHEIFYDCALNLSRSNFHLPNYKLPTVCEHIGHKLENHHNPVDDAVAAAKVYLNICKDLGRTSCEKHYTLQGHKPFIDHELIERMERRRKEENERKIAAAIEEKIALYPNVDVNNPFFMKKITITGSFEFANKTKTKNKFKELGANISTVVNDKTEMFIVGSNPDLELVEKAKELKILSISEPELHEQYSKYLN